MGRHRQSVPKQQAPPKHGHCGDCQQIIGSPQFMAWHASRDSDPVTARARAVYRYKLEQWTRRQQPRRQQPRGNGKGAADDPGE